MFRSLLAALGAAMALVLAVAGPASAHASLERTDPSDGSVLAVQPAVIAAQFDESVGVSADSLRVFSPDGTRVDNGTTTHGAQDDIITVSLRSGLGNGTYTVAWHVVSADSHPVSGAFTFSVGAPSRTTVNATAVETRSSTAVGVVYGAARWAAYLSFALLAGTIMFLALCWPKGATARGTFRLIVIGWVTLVASSVLQLLLQGVYSSGLPVSRIFDPSVIQVTTATRFGSTIEVRLLILALAAPAVTIGVQRLATQTLGQRMRSAALVLLGTLGAAATWAATGHASTGIQVPISVVSDILHLTAMAVWLGGLAVLTLLVLRDPEKPKQAAAAVKRFSTVALTCVLVMIGTGTYQAWRDVGSLHVLFDETYGRLVLVKISGLLVLIGLGYYARLRIASGLTTSALAPTTETTDVDADDDVEKAHAAISPASATASLSTASPNTTSGRSGHGPGLNKPGRRTARVGGQPRPHNANGNARVRETLSQLRRSVAAETAIVLIVLAATAIVVDSVPGRGANGLATEPGSTDVSLLFNTGTAAGTVLVVVEPGKIGPNQSHLLIENTKGEPYSPVQVAVSYSLPARNIGPINSKVSVDGPGHYVDTPTPLTFAGQWQVAITIRSDDFDETTIRVPFLVTP
ncbi:MAG TPA: copper resistance protein CopC [Actinocrinis sp.]|uniref:copper resistance CopC/CopD family protein n=1 Tax=Actinocrinis sp. TaxID=1920516 RepID=UPI002DDCE2CD|nr:copper resistance protein CopC [Actinocrinis sp.]HEV2344410.1 copper resistance protein CopC [Actinocrinis sp.]